MTQVPAGWYADPTHPGLQRWWDGGQWTTHTTPLAPTAPGASYGAAYPAANPTANPAYGVKVAPTTPDGQPLAGWWARVGSSLIDGLITAPITILLSSPFLGKVIDVYSDYFREVQRATENGTPQPSAFSIQGDLAGSFAIIGLIGIAVSLVYSVGFWRWKQATPGKLALGLRIRRRDVPGPLPWSTIFARWGAQYGAGLLGLVPLVGGLASLYSILDVLWPLWDGRKQALHDKVAGTNVVRIR